MGDDFFEDDRWFDEMWFDLGSGKASQTDSDNVIDGTDNVIDGTDNVVD